MVGFYIFFLDFYYNCMHWWFVLIKSLFLTAEQSLYKPEASSTTTARHCQVIQRQLQNSTWSRSLFDIFPTYTVFKKISFLVLDIKFGFCEYQMKIVY